MVIVGSGSAKGAVAACLCENPACSVLPLETGRNFRYEERSPSAFLTGGALVQRTLVNA